MKILELFLVAATFLLIQLLTFTLNYAVIDLLYIIFSLVNLLQKATDCIKEIVGNTMCP